ncbi:MAG: hypothetical protein A3G75_10310 [Verrucomicrobia bacterium RIFCSPLOWO2_12_FULL_64_8]|nr:MAG: hypothetical protein A3G75_10310 [Verrucomicrobia bacterium RIFCSPLOWO2_12_FULL_64_8]
MKVKILNWINEAPPSKRNYRKMVIAWQNSRTALNATVLAFNAEYLKPESQKTRDPHHILREIAVKKLTIASLFELRPQLDRWYKALDKEGLVSFEAKTKKKDISQLFRQIPKFEGIRMWIGRIRLRRLKMDDLLPFSCVF